MYEIWLVLNILWEIALTLWPVVAGAVVLWLVLMVLAWRNPGSHWRAGLPVALLAALIVGVLVFLVLPGQSSSSFTEMGYWVDWLNLLAMAAGFGAIAAAFVWPLAAMLRKTSSRKPA